MRSDQHNTVLPTVLDNLLRFGCKTWRSRSLLNSVFLQFLFRVFTRASVASRGYMLRHFRLSVCVSQAWFGVVRITQGHR